MRAYPGLCPGARSQVLAVDVLRECEGVARLLMRQPAMVVGYSSQNQVAPLTTIQAGELTNAQKCTVIYLRELARNLTLFNAWYDLPAKPLPRDIMSLIVIDPRTQNRLCLSHHNWYVR